MSGDGDGRQTLSDVILILSRGPSFAGLIRLARLVPELLLCSDFVNFRPVIFACGYFRWLYSTVPNADLFRFRKFPDPHVRPRQCCLILHSATQRPVGLKLFDILAHDHPLAVRSDPQQLVQAHQG